MERLNQKEEDEEASTDNMLDELKEEESKKGQVEAEPEEANAEVVIGKKIGVKKSKVILDD
jgi:hypothetical protein